MVINKLHIKSPGTQHPDLVALKTLRLTDQEPRGRVRALLFHLCPMVTRRLILKHLPCRNSPTRGRKAAMSILVQILQDQRLSLQTCGRSSPNDQKQPSLESTSLYIPASLTQRDPGISNPKTTYGPAPLCGTCPPLSPRECTFWFNKLLYACYFPSGCLYSSVDPHVNLPVPHVNLPVGNPRTETSTNTMQTL